jgi:hypothetical protein
MFVAVTLMAWTMKRGRHSELSAAFVTASQAVAGVLSVWGWVWATSDFSCTVSSAQGIVGAQAEAAALVALIVVAVAPLWAFYAAMQSGARPPHTACVQQQPGLTVTETVCWYMWGCYMVGDIYVWGCILSLFLTDMPLSWVAKVVHRQLSLHLSWPLLPVTLSFVALQAAALWGPMW